MGAISDAISSVGDFISNTVESVVSDPVGAIVSVGAMAMGVPPVFAGALGGAASAAENGGNILEGALTGGAMGFVGGEAGGAAADAGAGSALAGAAGGAAAGATGAALTGQDIIQGALKGGAMGGATGYVAGQVLNQDGTFTRTNDDGSVVRFNSNGDILQVSPATDSGNPAPVYNYNPDTQQLELVSGNGTNALNILDATQTADLMKNIDPRMVNSLAADNNGEQPFRVEVGGLPGTAENPGYANIDARTPGTDLATFDQIDAGKATWNPAANAWEITTPAQPVGPLPGEVITGPTAPTAPTAPAPYTGPDTYTFDDGSTISINPNGSTSFTDATGGSHNTNGGTAYASEGGATTYKFDDGSWMSINPDGSSVVADSNGNVTTHAAGTYTGSETGGTPTDLGEVTITAPRITDPAVTPDLTGVTVTPTTTPTDTTTPTTPDTTLPYNPVQTPTPVTPVFPVVTPPGTPTTPTGGGTPGTTPTNPADIGKVNPMTGLNPGFIQPTAFYHTTSPAQAQYYWGPHGFQSGSKFNQQQWNQAPAPETPWGIQNIAKPMTPEEYAAAYQGRTLPAQAPLPVATRLAAPVAGPVVPA